MQYDDFEKILSPARLNRFLKAVNNNKAKALLLYRLNIKHKGTQPKQIFIELNSILNFRNRVAHYEPICFNGSQCINLDNVIEIYNSIIKLTQWLSIDDIKYFEDLNNIGQIVSEINQLNSNT